MAYLTTQSATQNVYFSAITGALDAFSERVKRRRLYRETLDGLSALSNRDLADLGLHRSELQRVAWEAAYKFDI